MIADPLGRVIRYLRLSLTRPSAPTLISELRTRFFDLRGR